ncbi:hypothetical protein [Hymenobacter volaticus]|uniref:hypothetical protein n=1 Tax=Hymenobacter volaticus TaxID=2932254 RepID=UPI001FD70FDE|nr:hypothetical protein [Hymenobacter volaticus]
MLGLVLATTGTAYSQGDTSDGLASKFSRYQQAALPEKLFLHLDRPLYLSGEMMWFKIYAVEGTYSRPLPLSTVAYVEVLDKEKRPVAQAKVSLKQATGQGSFLLSSSLPSGTYTVRAYTNWMKNFGPEYYFQNTVTVINPLVASGSAAAKDSAAYDVQFFPEGGNLVQGLSSKVAFKVTAKTGTGVTAQGKLLNQSGAVVATFKTLRYGMGSFTLTPQPGVSYTALITVGKQVIRHSLPRVFEQGYVMLLENSGTGPLTLTVNSTSQSGAVFLLAHSRQKVAAAAQGQLVNGQAAFSIDKGQLLDGISHFTLFDAQQKPLCERLYFQQPKKKLSITARPDKNQYTLRDKVAVELATATQDAQRTAANLSMAVFRLDSLTTTPTADINSYLWLTSDLKGQIEHPEYYFTDASPETAEAADNLMLTQGWSRFRWEDALAPTLATFPYSPELHGHVIQGRITQAGTNRPVKGAIAYLASPSRITRLTNDESNDDGLVQFEINDFDRPKEIVVQIDPQQDSTHRIEILNPFSPQYATTLTTPFIPLTRFQQDYTKRHFQTQVQAIYSKKYESRYSIPPADSMAFYGKPDEIYFLDKYTRFKVLEEVMREYVPGVIVRIRKDGFHFLVTDKVNKTVFNENPLVLLDGVPIFNINKMMAMDPLKIRKLEVVDSHYFQGMSLYSGIVSFTTYKGDLEGFPSVRAYWYSSTKACKASGSSTRPATIHPSKSKAACPTCGTCCTGTQPLRLAALTLAS